MKDHYSKTGGWDIEGQQQEQEYPSVCVVPHINSTQREIYLQKLIEYNAITVI